MAIEGGLLPAKVHHGRKRPAQNAFTYSVYYLCFPLSKLSELSMAALSLNRFNLLSFYEKDHGPRDGKPLEPWIHGILSEFGVTQADGEIVLMAHPRVLGYVFNPVSFWFCLDRQGQLRAVLAEVNNTFGERHNYLIFHADQRPIQPDDVLTADKAFHVSPFLHVKGSYSFRFHYTSQQVGVWIDYDDGERKLLVTSVAGKRGMLNGASALGAFFRFPLVTFKTIALIHWQALKLLAKKVKYVPKPKPPETLTTRSDPGA